MAAIDRSSIYRILGISAIALVVGAAASLAAIGFVDAVAWLNQQLLIAPYARIRFEEWPMLVAAATVLVPALGGLVVGVVVRTLVRERRGLGPPDTIMAVQTGRPPPSLASGAGSTLAALLSLGCGASVGQYGPLVYMGTAIGALASRIQLGIRNLQSITVACGVAAAISTAFNAPIAGLVFAHEVILRHYSLRAFAPVTVASATGYVVANLIFERAPLFLVNFDGVRHGYEFFLFALEGVACAVLAAAYMGLIGFSGRMAARLPGPAPLRPALAGLTLGLVALAVPEVLGIGQETLRFATIEGAFAVEELALIVAAKLAMTALCLGFGFVGGVFSPALLIGILFGALYGTLIPLVLLVDLSGVVVYAICGMMALTSPVIGAPLTTILIVFELTRSYDLTIAAMVSVVFANLVAYRIVGRSMFDTQLRGRGFDLSMGRDKAILESLPVADYLSTACTRMDPEATVDQLLVRLRADGHAEAVLVDADGAYRGRVRLQDAVHAPAAAALKTLTSPDLTVFHETTTIWEAMQRLRGFIGEAVPLTRAADGVFLGVVPEEAVLRAYLESVHDLRREENEAA
jgi:CIC family chloride channel protein